MRKSDAERSYHQGSEGLPMVNVKVYGSLPERDEDSGVTLEWVEGHLSESQIQGWWDIACDLGFEDAQEDARLVFGEHVKCYREGRSGGWLVVEGLPDPDEWDDVTAAKWDSFAEVARSTAEQTPWRCMNLIGFNVYEPWLEKRAKKEALAAAAQLPILAGV